MKCLIVLSLLCIAVSAYSEAEEDAMLEELLKRYAEEKRDEAADQALRAACKSDVEGAFDYYADKDDEEGYATADLKKMEDACFATGSTSVAFQRMIHCSKELLPPPPETAPPPCTRGTRAMRHMFRMFAARRDGDNKCAAAANDLNTIIDGDCNSEPVLEKVCNDKGSVTETIDAIVLCMNNLNSAP